MALAKFHPHILRLSALALALAFVASPETRADATGADGRLVRLVRRTRQ